MEGPACISSCFRLSLLGGADLEGGLGLELVGRLGLGADMFMWAGLGFE